MKPAPFRYHRPQTLEQALALLAEHGDDAKALAGGQSLVPMMNLRLAQPAELVDLGDLPGLDGIEPLPGELRVGARVLHQTLADDARVRRHVPLLAEAAAGIGHYAIRQRGTLGGSLAHADPAAQLPLVAATLGAQIEVASVRGRRVVPAADFFVSLMTTVLEPDELIVAVRFPAAVDGERQAFRSFARRSGDYAIVAVAASVRLQSGRVAALTLGVGAIGPVPERLDGLCASQAGRVADDAWVAEVAEDAARTVRPDDDERMSALYRRELTGTLVARALRAALGNG